MSYEVPEWKAALSEQRSKKTGCIPWSYEWMLRYKRSGVDFITFQEDFDLQLTGQAPNHFPNVANRISGRYPSVEFKWQGFSKGKGNEKIQELEKRVTGRMLCAYSLTMIFGSQDEATNKPLLRLDRVHECALRPAIPALRVDAGNAQTQIWRTMTVESKIPRCWHYMEPLCS
jgi:hypothetical protein